MSQQFNDPVRSTLVFLNASCCEARTDQLANDFGIELETEGETPGAQERSSAKLPRRKRWPLPKRRKKFAPKLKACPKERQRSAESLPDHGARRSQRQSGNASRRHSESAGRPLARTGCRGTGTGRAFIRASGKNLKTPPGEASAQQIRASGSHCVNGGLRFLLVRPPLARPIEETRLSMRLLACNDRIESGHDSRFSKMIPAKLELQRFPLLFEVGSKVHLGPEPWPPLSQDR